MAKVSSVYKIKKICFYKHEPYIPSFSRGIMTCLDKALNIDIFSTNNIGFRDAKLPAYAKHSLSRIIVDYKKQVKRIIFLTTSFSQRLSHTVFLTTSFSQRLFNNVYLTPCFKPPFVKRFSHNVF